MVYTSQDRRARRTEKGIVTAYTQLLEIKPTEQITVKEICRLADINRSTFYLHFESVPFLHEQVEHHLFSQLVDIVYGRSFEELRDNGVEILTKMFEFLDENSSLCLVMLDRHGSITENKRLGKLIVGKLQDEWRPILSAEVDPAVRYNAWHLTNGFLGIILVWIESGKKESPAEMAQILSNIVTQSARLTTEAVRS